MTKKLLPLGVLAAFSAAGPLCAQSISALKNHDTKAPLDIGAKRFEIRDKQRQATFLGDVRIRQGNLALNSDKVQVFYDRSSGRNPVIRRVDATGAVEFSSPSEKAQAGWGVYDVEEGQLTLGGNVRLTRGTDVVQGQRLELNLRTGVTTLDGSSSHTSPAATPQQGSDGRVRARFSVPSKRN